MEVQLYSVKNKICYSGYIMVVLISRFPNPLHGICHFIAPFIAQSQFLFKNRLRKNMFFSTGTSWKVIVCRIIQGSILQAVKTHINLVSSERMSERKRRGLSLWGVECLWISVTLITKVSYRSWDIGMEIDLMVYLESLGVLDTSLKGRHS